MPVYEVGGGVYVDQAFAAEPVDREEVAARLLVGSPRSDQVRVTLMEYVSEAAERATPLKCDPQFGLGGRVADLVGEIGHNPVPVS